MINKLSRIALLSAILPLSGCITGTAQNAPAAAPVSPVMVAAKKNDVVFNYKANGKTYRVLARYDRILKGYGTALNITSGGTFNGSAIEDREAQNTIRDAFRAQGICKDGLHPGIIQFGYGFSAESGSWGAKVKCSEKRQENW